jgi:hypothetical protein
VDTRATADLQAQIERDRLEHGGEDLLDPTAPRE